MVAMVLLSSKNSQGLRNHLRFFVLPLLNITLKCSYYTFRIGSKSSNKNLWQGLGVVSGLCQACVMRFQYRLPRKRFVSGYSKQLFLYNAYTFFNYKM